MTCLEDCFLFLYLVTNPKHEQPLSRASIFRLVFGLFFVVLFFFAIPAFEYTPIRQIKFSFFLSIFLSIFFLPFPSCCCCCCWYLLFFLYLFKNLKWALFLPPKNANNS